MQRKNPSDLLEFLNEMEDNLEEMYVVFLDKEGNYNVLSTKDEIQTLAGLSYVVASGLANFTESREDLI